jgi:glutaredoxin
MKKRIWIFAVFFLAMGFYSCDHDKKSLAVDQKSVILVYGSEHCHHCKDFKAWLDEHHLKYTFYDVTKDMKANKEMMEKVRNAKLSKRVLYPVVDIDGRILSRPAHKTVEAMLKK